MIILVQQFINRNQELNFLEEKFNEDKAQLIIIYGRRRIGKTELIRKFVDGKKVIYHMCTYDSVDENINSLKEQMARITGNTIFRKISVNLFDLFKYFKEQIGQDKVVICIDEFPYLVQMDRSIPSVFQKIFDLIISESRIYMILSGSSIGVMENEVLSYRSPLYGRRTGSYEIQGFDLKHISSFYEGDMANMIKIASVFGNSPYYLSLIDRNESVAENIKKKILTKGEILYEEPRILMKQEFNEPRVYEMLIRNIANGYVKYGELQNAVHMDKGNISRYLETLISSKIIDYVLPFNQRRKGIYEITDSFLNFYYRFVYPNKSDLEIGNIDIVYSRIEKELNAYYGKMFERIVLDLINKRILEIPLKTFSLYRYWHKETEIDGIAVEINNKKAAFIEIKFSESIDGIRITPNLINKSKTVPLYVDEKYYILIAKSFKTRSDDSINIDLDQIEKSIFK